MQITGLQIKNKMGQVDFNKVSVQKLLDLVDNKAKGPRGLVTANDAKEYIRDNFTSAQDFIIDGSDDSEEIAILGKMAYIDLDAVSDPDLQKRIKEDPALKSKLKEAQISFRQALKSYQPKSPPGLLVKPGLYDVTKEYEGNLYLDPYRLPVEKDGVDENLVWSEMRLQYKGKQLNIGTDKSRNIVNNAIKSNLSKVKSENPGKAETEYIADALVKGLWENTDYDMRGVKKRIFRMEEIKGAMDYINSLEDDKKDEFKKAFFKSMGEYIQNEFGEQAQFTLDSLLALYQSTDWARAKEGNTSQQLRDFVKEIGIGIAENTELFVDKKVLDSGLVVSNYDGGLYDHNSYGSMLLVKYENRDGTYEYEWVEYESASQVNKVRYVFDDPDAADVIAAGRVGEILGPDGAAKTLQEVNKELGKIILSLMPNLNPEQLQNIIGSVAGDIQKITQGLGGIPQVQVQIQAPQIQTQQPQAPQQVQQQPSQVQQTPGQVQSPNISAPTIGSTQDLGEILKLLFNIKSILEGLTVNLAGGGKIEDIVNQLKDQINTLEGIAKRLEGLGFKDQANALREKVIKPLKGINLQRSESTEEKPKETGVFQQGGSPSGKTEEKPAEPPKVNETLTTKRPIALANFKSENKIPERLELSKGKIYKFEFLKDTNFSIKNELTGEEFALGKGAKYDATFSNHFYVSKNGSVFLYRPYFGIGQKDGTGKYTLTTQDGQKFKFEVVKGKEA